MQRAASACLPGALWRGLDDVPQALAGCCKASQGLHIKQRQDVLREHVQAGAVQQKLRASGCHRACGICLGQPSGMHTLVARSQVYLEVRIVSKARPSNGSKAAL